MWLHDGDVLLMTGTFNRYFVHKTLPLQAFPRTPEERRRRNYHLVSFADDESRCCPYGFPPDTRRQALEHHRPRHPVPRAGPVPPGQQAEVGAPGLPGRRLAPRGPTAAAQGRGSSACHRHAVTVPSADRRGRAAAAVARRRRACRCCRDGRGRERGGSGTCGDARGTRGSAGGGGAQKAED